MAAPYQWLEQTDSVVTQDWINTQADISSGLLGQLPGQTILRRQLSQLQDFTAITPPQRINGAYYFLKTEQGKFQGLFYRDSLQGQDVPLIDPVALGWAPTAVITSFTPSNDGTLLAIRKSVHHSEWETILIYDLQQKAFLQDTLKHVRHTNITWYRGGFFYSRFAQPDSAIEPYLFQQVYYHRAGTDQSEDELVYADRSDPRFRFETYLDAKEEYLLIVATNAKGHQAFYGRPVKSPDAPFFAIAEDLENRFEWAGADVSGFYLITDLGAPNRRLIRVNPDLPAQDFWETVLPESTTPLKAVHWIDRKLLAVYQSPKGNAMALYDTKGQLLKRPKLPEHGRVINLSSQYDQTSAFISYGHILEPPQVYHLDLTTEQMTLVHAPVITLKPGDFETRLVSFKSYDGTMISMYVVHKKGIKLNGQHPTLLFAGGRQSGPFAPMYHPRERLMAQLMLEQGGICAIPALRGGSALSTPLRRSGQQEYKQNTFDDYQAAAEYLIANQYTNAGKLGTYGEGHGALITIASLAQRPDLFGTVLAADGLYDLLRYPERGSDWQWLPEFGAPTDPKQFDHIYAYSPVHKLPADQYPATLLAAHRSSDAVQPFHTWKMGAVLQHQQSGKAPVLVYPVEQERTLRETGAEMMAFLLYHLKTPVQE